MAAKVMTDALQNNHPEVPFTHVGDDIISALTELANIFKLKLRKTQPTTLPAAPPTVNLRPCLTTSSNPILAAPMPPPRQTRSQTTIHARDTTNSPLLPRVVTPMMRNPSPPRVPMRSRNLSPRNLSQDEFCCMDTSQMAIALGNNHWFQCSHSPRHRKRNGIHGTYEEPLSTATLETRLWQQMQAPVPRDSRHSWNLHMFLYHFHQPPERHKNHLRKNSLRLQTSHYSGNVATSTADITTFKILINSNLSTEDAAMMMIDIKNYYLGTPLPRF
jgi:hypothetical protein